MAELLYKIGDGANYDDGDVICAFSDRRILAQNAAMICHIKRTPRNGSGLLVANSLAREWFRNTSRYWFRRISATEVRRVDLLTRSREVLGPTPNSSGESIDLRLFLRRRKQNPNHCIFGEDGSEFWYGGTQDLSITRIERVWDRIEERTTRKRTQDRAKLWPMGRLDIRHHLAVRTDAMNDTEADDLIEPEFATDDNGVFIWQRKSDDVEVASQTKPDVDARWNRIVVRKRRRNTRWRDLLADIQVTREQVENREFAVGRETTDDGRPRYESKEQPNQRRSRIRKKQRRRRQRD